MARQISAGTAACAQKEVCVRRESSTEWYIRVPRSVLSPLETILNATVGKNIRITSCGSGYSLNLVRDSDSSSENPSTEVMGERGWLTDAIQADGDIECSLKALSQSLSAVLIIKHRTWC